MIVILAAEEKGSQPSDVLAARRRARDAWCAVRPEGPLVVEPEDPRASQAGFQLFLSEPEAVVPPDALSVAVSALADPATSCVLPGGFFPGGMRHAEPYATVWEFEAIAKERSGGRASASSGPVPVELRRTGRGAAGSRVALADWIVHSFGGRKGHARPEVGALVPRGSARVLDVGCAEGALGALLTSQGARVTGIEPDPVAAEAARGRIARVLASSLDDAWDELDSDYDVVVAADLLEHLEDPVTALHRLRSHSNRDAVLVFSLPNASHVSVLAGALQGRWDRALEGIVADDHRTYAGRAGWTRLLQAGGWRTESWIPVPLVPDRTAAWVSVLESPELSQQDVGAVQWLGVARKTTPGAAVTLDPVGDLGPFEIDPLRVVRDEVASTRVFDRRFTNAVAGEVLEPLLRGEVASGFRAALAAGVTASGLQRRFAGSGLTARVSHADSARLPDRIAEIALRAASAGLPIDQDALSASAVVLSVRPS